MWAWSLRPRYGPEASGGAALVANTDHGYASSGGREEDFLTVLKCGYAVRHLGDFLLWVIL